MDLGKIAEKWQAKRDKENIYKVVEDPKKPKFYILDMFPYPSGAGLHVGHPKGYIATDVIARKKTLQGFNVLHPMGFDTFGLGTEQYAIEKKMKPQAVAKENIENFKRQLKMFGLTYDRDRSFSTADPDYFRRTQRIFLKLYTHYYDEKKQKAMPIENLDLSSFAKEGDHEVVEDFINNQRLAYVDYKPINRCPKCKTGLANEDLADGKCERCGSPVEQKPMKQWVLRITKYAERLLQGLDALQWDEAMKDLERNRIGKSIGTQFKMEIDSTDKISKVLVLHGLSSDSKESRFPRLKQELEKQGIEVWIPDLPKTETPKLEEQLQFLEENYKEQIDENTIIIGHSLGCFLANQFILKYNKKIKKLINVAPVHEDLTIEHDDVNNYIKDIKTDTKKLGKLLDENIVFISKDDELIPYEEAKTYYEKSFENVNIVSFEDKRHFNEKRGNVTDLPKILEYISSSLAFEVYTTRVDTVFGMSFVVMSPEHTLVNEITTDEHKKSVEKYQEAAKHKTQLERTELQKDKSGQFTGAYAINPFNDEKVPIYIADYVLANYGSGVVMAVPAHDERDFEFALKYDIPITQSIAPKDKRKALIIHGFGGTKKSNRLTRLTKELENQGIEVFNETLPNTNNPNFEETMDFLKPYFDKLDAGSILIGHSLGGKFALKLLEQSKKTIGTTVLVAPITDTSSHINDWDRYKEERKESDIEAVQKITEIEYDIKKIDSHSEHKIILLAKDDPYIDVKTTKSLSTNRNEIILDKKGHFQSKKDKDILSISLNNLCCFTPKGILVNSGEFSGMKSDDAITAMNKRLEKKGIGGKEINFKMQDRVFSRQRYRGEPFPILRTSNEGRGTSDEKKKNKNSGLDTSHSTLPMDEADLPLELPDIDNYEPTGTIEGPLANVEDRVNITLPDGTPAKRETNTMPGRAGSSRYWLRYMDPKNNKELVSSKKEKYRGNVDVYVGGAEHVTRHMIYARFWQKFLFDMGVVTHDEPFKEYHYVGLIMAEDGRKMSKRRGNTIDPDEIINEYGHDTFRVYEMFMGPFDQAIARSTNGVKGAKKFLEKIVLLKDKIGDTEIKKETDIILNQTIKKLTDDIDGFRFNTCISQLMIFVNHLTELPTIDKKIFETLTILLSPFAPHLAEELRSELGNEFSIFTKASRPRCDEKCLESCNIKIAVQVNGKVRGTICISKDTTQDEAMGIAKADEKIAAWITETPKKIIYIQGKILNIVI